MNDLVIVEGEALVLILEEEFSNFSIVMIQGIGHWRLLAKNLIGEIIRKMLENYLDVFQSAFLNQIVNVLLLQIHHF